MCSGVWMASGFDFLSLSNLKGEQMQSEQQRNERIRAIAEQTVAEIFRAMQLHSSMSNAHEALAVIEEEVFEFKLEVYKKQSARDPLKMRSELVQTAAMCIRAIHDLNLGSEEGGCGTSSPGR